MPTEIFTKEQFEAALPHGWTHVGPVEGEHVYMLPVPDTNKRIMVRSSVDAATNRCADTGEDSIRLWVEYHYRDTWRPLAKLDRWTTRVPGWARRLNDKIEELTQIAVDDSTGGRTAQVAQRAAEAIRKGNADEIQDCTPKCPKCGSTMRLRHRRKDNAAFWGCPQYPECKGTQQFRRAPFDASCPGADRHQDEQFCPFCGGSFQPAEPVRQFVPSPYQVAIFREIQGGEGHLVVEAVAGSGKTTTIVRALDLTPRDKEVGFVAFNRHIARELAQRAPAHVHVSTLHSLGFGNIRTANPQAKFDEDKVQRILSGMAERAGTRNDHDRIKVWTHGVRKLVSLCKATLQPPTLENIEYLAERYDIELDGDLAFVQALVQAVWDQCYRTLLTTFDYDDMIWASATGLVACRKFDILFVDEAQDLNQSQIQMALRTVRKGGRIIAVGDRWQSIYGFRGADTDAIPNIIEALHAGTLPLSITYRCPKSHVELAQNLVPHIEAAEWAEQGILETLPRDRFLVTVDVEDLVLCRTNAPLVRPALALIREGVKAIILGRDIGANLLSMVRRVQKQADVWSLPDTLLALRTYVDLETDKLVSAGKSMRAASLRDNLETIIALCDGLETVQALEDRIARVFSDENKGVTFSTVHRAKGTEASRVFILRPELMPHPKASAPWELQQEQNIRYVAFTRSKSALYIIEGEE